MDCSKIELVKYFATNVALLVIDEVSYVAKSPERTKIVIEDQLLTYSWLKSNYLQKKISLLNFEAELKLHSSLTNNLHSTQVFIPTAKIVQKSIYLMNYIEYDKINPKIYLHQNVNAILNALHDIQLAFHNSNKALKRRSLLKYNDSVVFYKNIVKVFSKCKKLKSVYYTFLLAGYFTRLYFFIPRNKTSIFNHGDLRIEATNNFYENPEIRNLGFKKMTGEVFIYDFGSSQTKSKIIFKDIVKIFNFYPKIEIDGGIIKTYLLSLNKSLGYSDKQLDDILKISMILCFFAEFSYAINFNLFSEQDVELLYKKVKSESITSSTD